MDKIIATNTEIDLDNILERNTLAEKQYKAIELPKIKISKEIKLEIEKQNQSLRKLSKAISNEGIKDYSASYTQLQRVTSGDNYKINTLLKLLDALNLEIVIQSKPS